MNVLVRLHIYITKPILYDLKKDKQIHLRFRWTFKQRFILTLHNIYFTMMMKFTLEKTIDINKYMLFREKYTLFYRKRVFFFFKLHCITCTMWCFCPSKFSNIELMIWSLALLLFIFVDKYIAVNIQQISDRDFLSLLSSVRKDQIYSTNFKRKRVVKFNFVWFKIL